MVIRFFASLVALWCATLSSPAWAGRLAVLELGGVLSPDERMLLTDTVRGAAVAAAGGRFDVMTRENMEVMLTDMGIDASCVSEGACEVETARNLGVDWVMSGSVLSTSGQLLVSLKLHETRTGSLLGTKRVVGTDLLSLLEPLEGVSGELLVVVGAPVERPLQIAPLIPPGSSAGVQDGACPWSRIESVHVLNGYMGLSINGVEYKSSSYEGNLEEVLAVCNPTALAIFWSGDYRLEAVVPELKAPKQRVCPWSENPSVTATMTEVTVNGQTWSVRGKENYREFAAVLGSCNAQDAARYLGAWRGNRWVGNVFAASVGLAFLSGWSYAIAGGHKKEMILAIQQGR